MKYPYDLHIHSVLSPCADCLMTPNNILNMAMLKGLKIVSVTDHNSMKQLPVLSDLASSYDFLFIPGVEISTAENHHVLVYFKTLEDALKFENVLDHYRIPLNHQYGMAGITDNEDNIIQTYPNISSEPLRMTYEELLEQLKPFSHLIFLAHVDRPNTNFNYPIQHYSCDGIELTSCDQFQKYQDGLSRFKILFNSDAHDLLSISEPTMHNTIELESLTIDAFFRYFLS